MENEILFTEKQRFTQWWVWLILLVPTVLTGYGVLKQVVFGQQFGDKPGSNSELIVVFGFVLFISLSFLSLRLETLIKKDGIYIKFFPFHGSFRFYPWEHINKSFVRKYNPIMEYGGWGLRGFGKNRAFNVSGNQGLQLELEGNKRILIGTKKPKEITEILRKIGKQL